MIMGTDVFVYFYHNILFACKIRGKDWFYKIDIFYLCIVILDDM